MSTMRVMTAEVEGHGLPLMQHNDRLANELHPYSKRLKHLTTERRKSGADKEGLLYQVFRTEWEGGLYHSETETEAKDDLGPYIPGKYFRACVKGAAKSYKMGKVVSGAVMMEANSERCPLEILDFDGDPTDLDALYNDGRFADTRVVTVMGRRILRTRPSFPHWRTKVSFLYDKGAISAENLEKFLREAAVRQGIGDARNLGHGRFKVISVKDEALAA